MFVVLVMLSIYYTILTMLLLIYFDYNPVISSSYSMIIIQNLSRNECVWLNLGFYSINTLLFWVHTQTYYHIFWINFIREIFYYLRQDCRSLSQGLLQKLKPIHVPDPLLRT